MRETKYRGRAIEPIPNKWFYGGYVKKGKKRTKHYIVNWDEKNMKLAQVDPKSIGQYTGLKDSFKNDIYEGDVLRVTYSWSGDERYGVIEWDNENNASYVFCEKGTNAMAISQIFDEDGDYIKEVIGNIYEDEHLLD